MLYTSRLYGHRVDERALVDAERLRTAVGEFVRRIRAGDAMPANQQDVLRHLSADGALSIADLAVRQGVRHQSMARTVKLLEAQQLVTVGPDAADRRRVVVRATERGVQQLAAGRTARARRIAEDVDRLDDADRELLARLPDLLDRLGTEPPQPAD